MNPIQYPIMSSFKFQKIVLIGRKGVNGILETLAELKEYLQKLNIDLLDEASASEADLFIVVGGDGSLLQASHLGAKYQIPVLGINRGHLGFLTDIHPNELSHIEAILKGDYQQESRFLLEGEVSLDPKKILTGVALNEVALLPSAAASMIEFDVWINDQFVCHQRADGMIIATPTGSTAYALSGGGPILHPSMDAIVLVPMFPHTLSSRPIVVPGNSKICIQISEKNTSFPHLSYDGQERQTITTGGQLIIRKHPKTLQLIHPKTYDYFTTLREKLGWEKRPDVNIPLH